MEFKDKLKALRSERKLSQQALADAIHISRSAVAKWENGFGLPSQDALESLIRFLDVPEDYFAFEKMASVSDNVSSENEDVGNRWTGMWRRFCNRYTIASGCLLLIFGLFCFLTQWKFISLPMDGINIEWIYMFPDGRYVYNLDGVPENVYCSQWKIVYTEDGRAYKIPKRSIIELNTNSQPNQLLCDQLGDPLENNAANEELGLPHITKWYLGEPGDAILVYEEGMDITLAPEELLRRWGYKSIMEPTE
jgi:transcriptional regulator with XRE-family HTH domain